MATDDYKMADPQHIHQVLQEDKVMSILGIRGSGKTLVTRDIVNHLVERGYPVYVYDIVHNYPQVAIPHPADEEEGTYSGDPSVSSAVKWKAPPGTFIDITSLKSFSDLLEPRAYSFREQKPEDFTRFCRDILALQRSFYRMHKRVHHAFVVFDEVYLHVNHHTIDSAKNDRFKQIIIVGRNYGLGVICTAQRPAILAKTILSQSSIIATFQMPLQADQKALVEYVDSGEIATLKRYHSIVVDVEDRRQWACDKEYRLKEVEATAFEASVAKSLKENAKLREKKDSAVTTLREAGIQDHRVKKDLLEVRENRSKRAKTADEKRTAKEPGEPTNPVDAAEWLKAPGRSDLKGIDTEQAAQSREKWEAMTPEQRTAFEAAKRKAWVEKNRGKKKTKPPKKAHGNTGRPMNKALQINSILQWAIKYNYIDVLPDDWEKQIDPTLHLDENIQNIKSKFKTGEF